MEEKKKYKTAEVAADWWTNAVFECGAKIDIGAQDKGGKVNEALLNFVYKINKERNKGKKEAFHKALETIVNIELNDSGHVCLSVDYYPCDLLGDAAFEARIETDMGVFPPKTIMNITCDKVEVKNGYGDKLKTIYDKNANKKSKKNFDI